MTNPESKGRETVSLHAALGRLGLGGDAPIRPGRRLIPPASAGRVAEFFSSRVGGRIVAIPLGGEVRESHHRVLAANGIPVLKELTELQNPDFQLLEVPVGAYPLSARLHLIQKDVGSFGSLFVDMVKSQRLQHEAGLGVTAPGETSLLSHFAVVEDQSPTGLSPCLLPPYDIDMNGTPEAFTAGLLQELGEARFTPGQIAHVFTIIQEGAGGGAIS